VVARHGGKVPADLDALLALPGMGPYTAGAVASLAFGVPAPAVDGNVLRVVARLTADEDDITKPATRKRIEAWVRANQPREAPGAFNEALMELGATVCVPRAPRCEACPLAEGCEARRRGLAGNIPRKVPKTPPKEVHVALAIARRGSKLLLQKPESGLLAGTWGLPVVEVRRGEDPREALAAEVARLTGGAAVLSKSEPALARHQF